MVVRPRFGGGSDRPSLTVVHARSLAPCDVQDPIIMRRDHSLKMHVELLAAVTVQSSVKKVRIHDTLLYGADHERTPWMLRR